VLGLRFLSAPSMVPSIVGQCLTGPLKLLFRGSLPKIDCSFQAEWLEEPASAKISRDSAGVPHISAATENDIFFLNGVVHAQDRLWQLHSTRMLSAGRLCEFAGLRALEVDRLCRQLGFRYLAEGDLKALRQSTLPEAAESLRMIEAYTRGVNWAVAQATRGGKLPAEFKLTGQGTWEEWQVVDTLAISRLYGFVMNFGFQHSLLRQGLIELFGPERAAAWTNTVEEEEKIPHVVDDEMRRAFCAANLSGIFNSAAAAFPRGQGSNWWAIHGSHTTTGKPILVGDPHLTIKVPNFWYEVHLRQVGSSSSTTGLAGITAYGVAPPGAPGILIGQNGFASWSITLAYCDVEDIFLERFRQSDGKYLHCGEWRECTKRTETIKVKGNLPQQCSCRSTCHGVILEGKTLMQFDPFKRAVSARMATSVDGWQDGEEIQVAYAGIPLRPESLAMVTLLKILHARSFSEFDTSLMYVSKTYSLNFGYADVAGHIGYVLVGEVPRRGSKQGDELLPLIGWTGEHDWIGFVTHPELPKAFDPPQGIIISANHKIIDASCYPNYLGRTWKSGYRAQAIQHELHKLLEGGRKVAPCQMPLVMMNVKSWAALEFVQEIRDVLPDVDTADALKMLTGWDGELRKDSVSAALYQLTHAELVRILLQRGCRAAQVPPTDVIWEGLEQASLSEMVAGSAFDSTAMLKILNEFQGHLHLNVLRILRSVRSNVPPCAENAGRRWWVEQAGGRDAVVNAAVRAAALRLRTLAGERWQTALRASWGRIHLAHFMHPITKNLGLPPGSPPFDLPSVESGGDTNTVLQAAPKSLTDLTATASNVSLRVIFSLADLADEEVNCIISPLGQSGQFNSPHYGDQNRLWASGKLRPIISSEQAVRDATVATMCFQQAGLLRSKTGSSCFEGCARWF